MKDVLRLLVCLPDHILSHALGVDECGFQHIAIRLIAFQLPVQPLVLSVQICDLAAQLLHLGIILLQLIFDLVQKPVYILGTVAAEVLLQIARIGHPAGSA